MSTQPHGFLRWEAPGRTPAVRLEFGVIERLTVDVMRGFGVTRRRGTEVGGILLGKIDPGDTPVVHVYDYETVPCEYSQGPSYILSERDRAGFREAVERWSRDVSPDQYVVGYLRSHTRDRLYLDEVDSRQFREYIDDPLAVALALKPFATKTAEAGFFLQSNGTLETTSPLPFSFIRSERPLPVEVTREPIAPQESIAPRPPAPRPAPPSPQPQSPPAPPPRARTTYFSRDEPVLAAKPVLEPQPQPPPPPPPTEPPRPVIPVRPRIDPEPFEPPALSLSSWRMKALWAAFTVAVFGFGCIAGYEYAKGRLPISPMAAPSDPFNVNLTATARDRSVAVRWDHNSPAIKTALRGVLTIAEGPASKQVRLDFPELRNGTVIYHNMGPEVHFTLELFFRDNRVLTERVTLRLP